MNATTLSACNFNFSPVKVERGRKFKGMAYFLDSSERGIAWRVSYDCARMWDPVSKRYVYANLEFCEELNLPEAEVAAAKAAYIKHTIDSTIAWCKSVKPNASDNEILAFARNCLRKQHPEMMPAIDEATPDNRDVVEEIARTIQWAMTLKTRACYMYGRYCAGGKPISDERKVRSALHALQKRGISKLQNFNEIWEMQLTVNGLPIIKE